MRTIYAVVNAGSSLVRRTALSLRRRSLNSACGIMMMSAGRQVQVTGSGQSGGTRFAVLQGCLQRAHSEGDVHGTGSQRAAIAAQHSTESKQFLTQRRS